MKRLVVPAVMSALLLAGCATDVDKPTAPAPERVPASASAPAGAGSLLARHGLAGKETVQVIDHLDRLALGDRPAGLGASVRVDRLVLSDETQEHALAIPGDRFYLSVAPYVTRTHECFYHSLTTCTGELAAEEIGITVVDGTSGEVLVDGTRTTFANGFVGLWLPRDIEGTLRVTHDGKVGETAISTGPDAPTCLTTLRLT